MNEMNITNAQYIVPIDETENTMIRATIDGVELYVPLNSATAITTKSCVRSQPVH